MDLEYVSKGEIFDFVANGGPFPETIARHYFKELLDGLEHIHSNGIVHRDIKPENVLISADYTLKISDFGYST
jgi:serine/threonine-protein kinase Chk1